MTLNELLAKFRADPANELYSNGIRRFDRNIAWIEQMFRQYSEALGISADELVEIEESHRDYWWPNYYQPCNFPDLNSDKVIRIFRDNKEFADYADEHWAGYKCPKCGDISPVPQTCIHRAQQDGICDWCSYGLFSSDRGIVILSKGIKLIPIFEPVEKEDKCEKEEE